MEKTTSEKRGRPTSSSDSSGRLTAAPGEMVHLLRAEAFVQAGDLAGAVEQYRLAIAADPGCFAAWNNLGNLFASLQDWATARTFLERAEALDPQNGAVKNNLANVLERCGHAALSVEMYRAAILLEPMNSQFRNNLGNALTKRGEWRAAEKALAAAHALRPDYVEAHLNLAYLYHQEGRAEDAELLYRRVLALEPENAGAHTFLGQLLLHRGEFEEGWEQQEWRWLWKDFPSPRRDFSQPQWCGEAIAGRRILLHAEQGFGDTIQFARYVPMVAALGAHVVLEVHPELVSLMRSLAGAAEIVAKGEPLPQFDLHCPLLSLPLIFETRLQTIPHAVPYLCGDSAAPAWLGRVEASTLRVGLVWAGNTDTYAQAERALPLAELHPLLDLPGIDFYSFQRGGGQDFGEDVRFTAHLPQSGDFSATAAALCQMDLLISVDTATAHLAGALGVPVWILLPYVCDWRWLKDGSGSSWYPSATLFRQGESRRWSRVVAQVKAALLGWSIRQTA